ncbi:MAG: rhodanese-like domain-containing protein [Alphaproteobacteria bacterium]
MTKSIMEAVAAARVEVPAIGAQDAARLHGQEDVLFVDVRDAEEVAQTGKIAGALNVSRGMLEFRADAATPYHDPAFDPDKTIILYCASGGRSALGGKALLEMGYRDVRNLGAFKDWADRGLPIEAR